MGKEKKPIPPIKECSYFVRREQEKVPVTVRVYEVASREAPEDGGQIVSQIIEVISGVHQYIVAPNVRKDKTSVNSEEYNIQTHAYIQHFAGILVQFLLNQHIGKEGLLELLPPDGTDLTELTRVIGSAVINYFAAQRNNQAASAA